MDWAEKASKQLDDELRLGIITDKQHKRLVRKLQDEIREEAFYPED